MNSSFWSREFVEFEGKGPGPIATGPFEFNRVSRVIYDFKKI